MCLPQGLRGGENFYIRAKSHEDVHGHAQPSYLSTLLNPSEGEDVNERSF